MTDGAHTTRTLPRTLLRGRVTPDVHTSNLHRTILASGWLYSSRAVVFGWALLLTHEFGIADYGIYAMAFAAGSVIGVPLDSYFTTRSPRVSESVFLRERTTRSLIGVGLAALGLVAWQFSILIGFAVIKAGSDVAFQATRSSLIRDGHPDRAQRAEAVRQFVGVLAGSLYVVLASAPTLSTAAGLYLAGCALPIVFRLGWLVHARPSLPEMTQRSAWILGESIGGVVYVHVDVLLLGLLASPTAAGYYAFGTTIVWSLAALGQSFGYTFHQGLRDAKGDVSAGPPIRTALWLSAATGSALLVCGLGLWQAGFDAGVWLTFVLLAPVSSLRTLSSVATVVLSMQHRDRFRLGVTLGSLGIKLVLLLLLTRFGGPGAAVAFLISDLVMSGAYATAVYGRAGQWTARPVRG